MPDIWDRIRTLEGKRLPTLHRSDSFFLVGQVFDGHLNVRPKDGKGSPRRVLREQVEHIASLNLARAELRRRTGRDYPNDQTSSYIAALIYEIEGSHTPVGIPHQAEKPRSTLRADEMVRFLGERIGRPDVEELLKEHMSRLPTFTPEFLAERERWSPDGWKYAGLQSAAFRTAWAPFADAVLEARHEEPDWNSEDTVVTRRFLRSVCRVLVRLEREVAFGVLNRTPDFRGFVRDQWDTEEIAWERLASVRAELR